MKNDLVSEDRKLYLRKEKRNKIITLTTQICIIVCFLIMWELMANAGVIDSFITSQPSRVIETLTNLSQNDLLKHIGITTLETAIGFLTGTLLRCFNSNCVVVVSVFV